MAPPPAGSERLQLINPASRANEAENLRPRHSVGPRPERCRKPRQPPAAARQAPWSHLDSNHCPCFQLGCRDAGVTPGLGGAGSPAARMRLSCQISRVSAGAAPTIVRHGAGSTRTIRILQALNGVAVHLVAAEGHCGGVIRTPRAPARQRYAAYRLNISPHIGHGNCSRRIRQPAL